LALVAVRAPVAVVGVVVDAALVEVWCRPSTRGDLVNARKPTVVESAAIATARYVVIDGSPYLAAAAFSLPLLVFDADVVAAGCDRKNRLYVSTAALLTGPHRLASDLEHEIWHLLRMHATRLEHHPHPPVAGLAACIEINDDMPDRTPTPGMLNLPEGRTAEWYADQITFDPAESCGSGAGADPNDWETDDDSEAGPSATEITILAHHTADEIRKQPPGTVPAGLLRWAEETLAPASVPWQQLLAEHVRAALGRAPGRADWTQARPSRRPNPDLIRPSMTGPQPEAVIVIDTSGSMSQDDLTAALSETQGVVDVTGGSTTVIVCDAAATEAQTVRDATAVRMVGGGGTDMRVGIDAATDLDPDVVIVITDGHTPWPETETVTPLIVVLVGSDVGAVPDWATTIRIDTA
jgi:predicted metal-dependent peptidase